MAFINRISGVLRQTVSKHANMELSASNTSLYQAIRSMSSSKLFVGGLFYGTDETSLREMFAQHGEVVEARIIMDRETGRSRGFGFVTYTSSEEASAAINALDGQDLQGRRIRVNYATERSRGGGFRGGFGNEGGNYGGGGGYGYGSPNYGGAGGYGNPSYGSAGGYGNPNYGSSGGYGDTNYGGGAGGHGNVGTYGDAGGGYNAGAGYGTSTFSDGGAGGGYNAGAGYGSSTFSEGTDSGVSNYAGGASMSNGPYGGSGTSPAAGGDHFKAGSSDFGDFATPGNSGTSGPYDEDQGQVDQHQREADAVDEFGDDMVEGSYKEDESPDDYANTRGA